jgi:hypothetical protein
MKERSGFRFIIHSSTYHGSFGLVVTRLCTVPVTEVILFPGWAGRRGDHRLHASQLLNRVLFAANPLTFLYFHARPPLCSPPRSRRFFESLRYVVRWSWQPRPTNHGARWRRRCGEADGSPSTTSFLPVSTQIWTAPPPAPLA